ncbi:hypothetical protein AO738_15095 [Pseudomonas citronellolis]|nr:hypothetical protein AO742_16845 [Pseudomonas citronellolis]KRW75624.1 hypothetical protein AO738_15095 [Pseudomonas citronellolis]
MLQESASALLRMAPLLIAWNGNGLQARRLDEAERDTQFPCQGLQPEFHGMPPLRRKGRAARFRAALRVE